VKALGVLLIASAFHAEAQMYKCVDERGATRYADQPGPGCKPAAIKPSPPISGEVRAPSQNFAGQDAELRRRQLEREAAAAQEREAREALAQRCARQREEYNMLTSGTRIFKSNEKGERAFVDDATRAQRIAKLQQDMRGCP
jgi:hypothetical protein